MSDHRDLADVTRGEVGPRQSRVNSRGVIAVGLELTPPAVGAFNKFVLGDLRLSTQWSSVVIVGYTACWIGGFILAVKGLVQARREPHLEKMSSVLALVLFALSLALLALVAFLVLVGALFFGFIFGHSH